MSIMLTWGLYVLISGVRGRLKDTTQLTVESETSEPEEKEEPD
jgi:hypothetical protein